MKLRDEEIRQADEVLKYLKEKKGYNIGYHPHPEGSECMKRLFLNNIMCEELGLVRHNGDIYSLTLKGREAAEIGIMAFLEEQEKKESVPVKAELVDNRPWYQLNKREIWSLIVGSVITAIFDILMRGCG